MHQFLTDYPTRLEAFQTGTLVDMNLVAARTFEQPVAFTAGLMKQLCPHDTRLNHEQLRDALRIVEQAHCELVQATGSLMSRDTVIVDFDLTRTQARSFTGLRVMFGFVADTAQDMAVPAVTIGRREDFELVR